MVDDTRTPEQGEETAESRGFSRRGFLAGAAGLTGVALSGAFSGVPALAASTRATSPGPTYAHWFLELNGVIVGQPHSVQGGEGVAEVVHEPPGPDGVVRKHLGELTYPDIVLRVGLNLGSSFYTWVSTLFNHSAVEASGAVIATDYDYKVKRRLEFGNAIVREVTFPALSAASTDTVFMTVSIAPQFTQRVPATGTVFKASTKPTPWLAGNFAASFGSLPFAKISKIDPFSARRVSADGTGRGLTLANVDFSELGVTLNGDVPQWNQFYERFVIQGNNSEEDEIGTGSIKFLAPNLSKVLAAIDLRQIGIFSLAPDGPEPVTGTRTKAGLYVEDARFHVNAVDA